MNNKMSHTLLNDGNIFKCSAQYTFKEADFWYNRVRKMTASQPRFRVLF